MKIIFEPIYSKKKNGGWTEIEIGFKSRNQGPLIMIIKTHWILNEDHSQSVGFAEVLFDSSRPWRKLRAWWRKLIKVPA